MNMKKYKYNNRKQINDLYLHDTVIYDISVDIGKKEINISGECEYPEHKKIYLTFENVINFEFDRLDFWGEGGDWINDVYVKDDDIPQQYINTKLEKAISESKKTNTSEPLDFFSKDKNKFISICINLHSGDEINIICETLIQRDN